MNRVGLIGFGYWGPNVARNLMSIADTQFTVICDPSPFCSEKAAKLFPNLAVYRELKDAAPFADSFVIATPINTHYSVAKFLIQKGKNVLIQKPMADSYNRCDELLALSIKHKVKLMVAHTFLFSPPVKYIKDQIYKGELGELNYISSTRINLGLFSRKNNVLWDLAPHDFSIIRHLYPHAPRFISAVGKSHAVNGIIDCANISIGYTGSFMATVNINWLSPIKVRSMIVAGADKMVVYDDTSTEKVKVYDSGVSFSDDVFAYRKGDIYIPKLDEREPIYYECLEFLKGSSNISDGFFGREIVRMIEAAESSIYQNGEPVEL